ncbi:MAG: hypothetical protein HOV68_13775 [Streptomycetaceae bacterium]|nr:hypothetical protein [Streptomycetaceae bacterium]
MIPQPQIPNDRSLVAPPAPRSFPTLVARHVATVLFFPVHVVLIVVFFVFYLAFALVGELLSWLPGVEDAWEKAAGRMMDALPLWPRWFVSFPELRHEGDAAFYRARVERRLRQWQSGKGMGRSQNGKTYVLAVHKYRALSPHEALQMAAHYGFHPYGPDAVLPTRRLRLHRPDATQPPTVGTGQGL